MLNSEKFNTVFLLVAAANIRVIIYYVLEQPKETVLSFSKGTTKDF